MPTMQSILRLANVADRNIMQIGGDYSRAIRAIIRLSEAIEETEYNDCDPWYLETSPNMLSPSDLLVAAFWHLTEWHDGQWSQSYADLCTLGRVFNPGMTSGPEPDSAEYMIYEMLQSAAEDETK